MMSANEAISVSSGDKTTTISIPLKVKQRLERLGHKGETWEQLLTRLIEERENK
jgi:predicted DNA-binding protein